jgi:hypothetical protein
MRAPNVLLSPQTGAVGNSLAPSFLIPGYLAVPQAPTVGCY